MSVYQSRLLLIGIGVLVMVSGCQKNTAYLTEKDAADPLHTAVQAVNDAIVFDIFSPPVASRVYAYPSVAAYEGFRNGYSGYKSLAGQLNGLTEVPQPDPEKEYFYPVVGLTAYLNTGKALVFSEPDIEDVKIALMEAYKEKGVPGDVFENSVSLGEQISEHILAWAGEDNYSQTRTFPKFNVTEDPDRWKPTPPAYMEGIEPHWNKIRPFIIDSATQFIPIRPTPFDMNKGSDFFKEVMEVYEVTNELDEEQQEIASFWDCNPYVMNVQGHVMFATKKITPGGHWVGITKLSCRKENKNIMESAEAYVYATISLADAFISCWDEKYRSSLIRPETVINQHVDPEWVPLLQTPPFPEYTSGHSVISRAAAISLTHIFGDNFAFRDTTEMAYGLPPREYDSFMDASEEAAISRLYGGIHYRPAIDNGVAQGEKVGNYVIANISTREEMAIKEE
ncbi:MAG: vanadium-dependent haloperoxidase [Bacteroidota bacterium]